MLFLVDQSANVERQCEDMAAQFGVSDQISDDLSSFTHTGAKQQIDFVIDAIEVN